MTVARIQPTTQRDLLTGAATKPVYTSGSTQRDLITGTATTVPKFNQGSTFSIRSMGTYCKEGSQAFFWVTRTGDLRYEGLVAFSARSGSAEIGKDFAFSDKTLRFQPGQSSQLVWVQTFNDTVKEGQESFLASVSPIYSGDKVTSPYATGWITDASLLGA